MYDGKIGYPKVKEIGLAYAELRDTHPDDFPERWPELAASKGWPAKVPKKIKTEAEYDSDIKTQWIMAAITLPLGLWFGFKLLRESTRWVAMDEASGLTASGGHTVPWGAVTGLERERWKTKGIARVIYCDASRGGKERKILLDDFKSERAATGQIYDAVLERVDPDEAAAVAKAKKEAAAQAEPAVPGAPGDDPDPPA